VSAMRSIHPGEILREDFLPDYNLSAGTPRGRLEKIIRENRAVTADTAAREAPDEFRGQFT
jgi:antitoxin HigA-1